MVAQQTSEDTTLQLCEWACVLQWDSVPAPVRLRTAERVLDTLGLVVAGAPSAAGKAASAAVAALAMPVQAAAVRPTPADHAALLLGTLAHCRDFDDTFPESLAHPGSVVIPAALATAGMAQATDEDFAAAVVVGYEVAARLSVLAGTSMLTRGFHATGVIGAVAAASAAARALRLAPTEMVSAIGISCSMAGGLMAFLADGSWSKWMHAGWAAHGGVHAALLARAGFRGPAAALLGKSGLAQAFMGQDPPVRSGALTDSLGIRWFEEQATTKLYPCAHVIQPYIDAAITLKREYGLDAATVESVTCELPGWAVDVVALPRLRKLQAQTEMDAISSLPYMVACGFLDGNVTLASLTDKQRGRADIRELAAKVVHEVDDGLGRSLRGPVTVRTRSGAVHRCTAGLDTPGRERIRDKFLANVAFGLEAHRLNSARPFADKFLSAPVPSWQASRNFLASRLPVGGCS